jgi:hypothetical protein
MASIKARATPSRPVLKGRKMAALNRRLLRNARLARRSPAKAFLK